MINWSSKKIGDLVLFSIFSLLGWCCVFSYSRVLFNPVIDTATELRSDNLDFHRFDFWFFIGCCVGVRVI